MDFSEFKNCKLDTDEIINHIKIFGEEKQRDILKFIYSVLFHTDVQIENNKDLGRLVSAYLSYTEGNFAKVKM